MRTNHDASDTAVMGVTPQRPRKQRTANEPSLAILLVAALCLTAAFVLAAQGRDQAAAILAVVTVAALAVELVRMGRWQKSSQPSVLARLFAQAQAGRKLAIYDRDTGLFAHWYITLRGEEECARAARYDRALSLVMIEPRASNAEDAWAMKAQIGRWIQSELRTTDIAGYLGNGRYIILAPEADHLAIHRLVERIEERIAHVDTAISAFPDDGVAFQQLWRVATTRISSGSGKMAA